MSHIIETIEGNNGHKATIRYDEGPESPASWTNVGTLAYFTRNASAGDMPSDPYGNGPFVDDCPACEGEGTLPDDEDFPGGDCPTCKGDGYVNDGAALAARTESAVVTLPVYAVDGQMGTELSIADDWERANGWIYATAASIAETLGEDATPEQIRAALTSELEAWEQWAQGDVYAVTIEDADGDVVDSVCGLYGDEYAEEEARRMLDEAAPNNQGRRRSTLDKIEASDYGTGDVPAGELARYAALSSRNEGRTHALDFADTKAEAVQALENGIGDWYPIAVIDLETGTEYPIETKLITGDGYTGEWRNEEGEKRYCPTCKAELEHAETDGDGPGEWVCYEHTDEDDGARFHYGQTLDAPRVTTD